jgi:hypothetical protein
MGLNLKKTYINDVVSTKEFHLDLEKDVKKIYVIVDIDEDEVITAQGCNNMDKRKFTADELYILHPGANVKQYLIDRQIYIDSSIHNWGTVSSIGNTNCTLSTTNETISFLDTTSNTVKYLDGTQVLGLASNETVIQLLWAPQKDITVHELAQCIPWINNPFINPDSPVRYQPHFKHFKFEDDEEYEHLFRES